MKLITVKLTEEELRRIFTLIGKGCLAELQESKSAGPVFSDGDAFLRNYIGAMAQHTVKFTPGVLERVEVSYPKE